MKIFIFSVFIFSTLCLQAQVKRKKMPVRKNTTALNKNKVTPKKIIKNSAVPNVPPIESLVVDITNPTILNDIKARKPEIAAEFPGGLQGYKDFLYKTLIYPKEAQEEYSEGRVYVNFIVCTDGNICNIKIDENLTTARNKALIEEALRVVKKTPKWKPAQIGKTKVESYYTLPINFRLSEAE